MLKLSIIVPTHDRPESLSRALESVVSQSLLPYEVIIVNDGSTEVPDELADKVRAAGVRLELVRSEVASLTRSRNLGSAAAGGDVLVHMDDDLILSKDFLRLLADLYEADAQGVVCGIGAVVEESRPPRLPDRLWGLLAVMLGREWWRPRRCAARRVRLPAALRGRLVPARRVRGGGMSFRRSLARLERFDESLTGCALGEDLAFSYDVGRRRALFLAPGLKVTHTAAPAGRPGMKARGRMYAANTLHIARTCVEGGAGTWLLVGFELAGTVIRYALWGLLLGRRRALEYACGAAAQLAAIARRKVREALCGC